MNNDAFKELEPNESVPEYLKGALVSEIDMIRDVIQFVNHFTDGFLSTALMCLSEYSESK